MNGDIQWILDHHVIVNRQITRKKLEVKILAAILDQSSFEGLHGILSKCVITMDPLKLFDPRFQVFVVFPNLLHVSLYTNILHGESELGL